MRYGATVDLTIDSRANPHSTGVTFEVSVQTDAPRSTQLGTVQVLVDDQSYYIALDQMSRGSLTLTDLNHGTYTVTAEYAGSGLVAAATSKPRTLTVR